MRELLFRGKRKEDGKWIYGFFVNTNDRPRIINEDYEGFYCEEEVFIDSVGQYADLKDKNGNEIYEGDILQVVELSRYNLLEYTSPVEYIESGFLVTEPNDTQVPLACFHNQENAVSTLFEIKVIGNIYDHPNLVVV